MDHGVDSGHAVASRQHAVVCGGRATALDVTEGRRARLDAENSLDFLREDVADTAEPWASERIEPALGVRVIHGVEFEALGNDNERCALTIGDRLHPDADLLDAGLLLGDQNGVGSCGHAGMQGDPTDVTAHHLSHHAAAMRVACGAKPIHRICGDLGGRVETERVVGGREVVVDGLGHTHDFYASIGQPLCGREGAFSADRDERVDAEALHILSHALGATVTFERICTRGAEDRSTLLADALDIFALEWDNVTLDHSTPAVTEPDEFAVVDLRTLEHGAANDSIQAWAVAPTGEDSDLHEINHGAFGTTQRAGRLLSLG